MTITRDEVGNIVVLETSERLDVSSAPALREAIEALFEQAGRNVLIDLSRVSYVSSIGLATLLQGAKLAQSQGGHFVLAGIDGMVRKVIRTAGLDRVIAAYPTRDQALSSFDWSRPERASGGREVTSRLTLPEEVLLLALLDNGQLVDLPEHALDFALAGAVLMDLCMRGRIDNDLQRVTVVDAEPIGDSLLDPALAAIACVLEPRGAEHWVRVLAGDGPEMRRRAIDRLVEREILRRKDSFLHWVLGRRRYPLIGDAEQREVRERVLDVIHRGEVPGPRDVAIIALADACAVFDAILTMEDMLDARPRIAEVARMDLLAQAMTRALDDAQSAERAPDWPDVSH